MKLSLIHHQPSWTLQSSHVDAALTRLGGQLGPVRFRLGRRTVDPFSVASWCGEPGTERIQPPLLRPLRGDFFCMPFGSSAEDWRSEAHPPHGECANGPWKATAPINRDGVTKLTASFRTKIRPGKLTKTIRLIDGHSVIYQTHTLQGYSGPMSLGHHPMLDFIRNGTGHISTSKFRFGQVFPLPFENPAKGGYQALKPAATFRRLDSVPALDGSLTDCSTYPVREGFTDFIYIHHFDRPDFAWTTVTFPEQGFLWFSLKDPRLLACTAFWHSHGGRHYAPWNGRHRGVLGIEDLTSYFCLGLADSARKNALNRRGIPTVLQLNPRKPLVIPYIMGVAAIPKGFDRVLSAHPAGSSLTFRSHSGKSTICQVDLSFLKPATIIP